MTTPTTDSADDLERAATEALKVMDQTLWRDPQFDQVRSDLRAKLTAYRTRPAPETEESRDSLITSALEFFSATGMHAFLLPIPDTTPTVWIAAGEQAQIRELVGKSPAPETAGKVCPTCKWPLNAHDTGKPCPAPAQRMRDEQERAAEGVVWVDGSASLIQRGCEDAYCKDRPGAHRLYHPARAAWGVKEGDAA